MLKFFLGMVAGAVLLMIIAVAMASKEASRKEEFMTEEDYWRLKDED